MERKRIYRVEPPEELTKKKHFTFWQPERISVKQGLQETAILFLAGYGVISAASLCLCVAGLIRLPDTVLLPAFFGYSNMSIPKIFLCTGIFAIQIYLIYRDLIRRSMAKTLFLIPAAFFLGQIYLLLPLL